MELEPGAARSAGPGLLLRVGIASGNCIVIYGDIWGFIAIRIMIYRKTYFIDVYI